MLVQSFKDMNGNRVKIGEPIVKITHKGERVPLGRVRDILKQGYFITVYTDGSNVPQYMPRVDIVKGEE